MGDQGGVDGNGVAIRVPDFSRISEDYWGVAEEAAQEVINCIHPTLDSVEKRMDVIEYVQNLVKFSLGFQVFPFGSVPLKTYLPDGDIDLTAINPPNLEEFCSNGVLSVLQREEQNYCAEYEVRDIQFINAEVKVVKCVVQNIIIDISFNQLGGISTLGFLEKIDRFVGKDHLFKRSILLIKTWCYYESRILGSVHGLLSTYALETLVLYIFQLFHSSLESPLQVLYKFLDYFSIFDWDNYCISVKGPVCKSSLPDLVVEMPDNLANNLMLSEEFLSNIVDMFTVLTMNSGNSVNRVFAPKHVNIVDPLKEYNNLGRSVHRGNFYRIRSAFKYGARKLGKIMSLPINEIADEIKKFFSNTLQRHLRDAELISPFILQGFRTMCSSDYANEGGERNSCTDDTHQSCEDYPESNCSSPRDNSTHESSSLGNGGTDAASVVDTEPSNPLADLEGDYDSHLRCIAYCHGLLIHAPRFYSTLSIPYQYPTQELWDTFSYPTMPTSCSLMNSAGIFMEPPNNFSIQSSASSSNGYYKPRGTETYFPSLMKSSWRTKKTAPESLLQINKPSSSNDNSPSSAETMPGESSGLREALSADIPLQACNGSGLISQVSYSNEVDPTANCTIEFGSLGTLPDEVISDPSYSNGLISPVHPQDNGNPTSGLNTKEERVADCSFHLKNEREFPALSR